MANIVNQHKKLLQEIVDRGHEIACHTMTHQFLTDLDKDERRREIVDSKKLLESKLDIKVKGFRAPALKVNDEVIREIEEAGYEYDSSMINSTCLLGERSYKCASKPFKRGELTEIPVSVSSTFKLPLSSFFIRVLGKKYLFSNIEKLKRKDVTPVIYVHPHELHSKEPKNKHIQRIGAGQRLMDIVEDISDNYSLVSVRDIYH